MAKLDILQKSPMKESEFIEQNKEKWVTFENNLSKKGVDPEKTSKLFIQITDDLSYARTFYKNRSVKNYLNGVAKLLFNDINKSTKNRLSAFVQFWKTDLPLVVYVARRAMLISFVVFVSCFILGVVTSIYDPDFAKTILGSGYIDMTNENIDKGDPMAVYKSRGEMETFLPIFFNNIRIDFMTFFSGIFMAVGTLLIMVVNGVMVGVFQYFFIEKGLFWESFLGIWTHGALEISSIIISGGAGLTLGKGLLFPGTYSRFQAFKMSGMNGLKIIMGVAPITLLAAFIEGFLTRHTDIPNALRFSFILLSFGFIFIYFFWYPRKVAKQTENINEHAENKPIFKTKEIFSPSEILSGGKIITETLRFFFKSFSLLGFLMLSVSFVFSVVVATDSLDLFYFNETPFFSLPQFFNYEEFPLLAVMSSIFFIVVLVGGFLFVKRKLLDDGKVSSVFKAPAFVNTVIATTLTIPLFVGLIMIGNEWFIALAFIMLPLLVFMTGVSSSQNISFFKAVNFSGGLLNKRWLIFVGISLVFSAIGMLFFLATNFALNILFIENALIWMLTDDSDVASKISVGISVFQLAFSFLVYLVLLIISNSLMFYTFKESYTAENLISRINKIRATE
jgi:uncharacterized membrane protein SpoIIM required for sporulation